MRKITTLTFIILLLVITEGIFSVTLETCNSGGEDWECDSNNICICEISGSCTNGDLLVYKNDITNLICAPPIIGSNVDIFWDECGDPSGQVKVLIDCEEGQSSEQTINIITEDIGSGDSSDTSDDDYNDGGEFVSSSTSTTSIMIYCNYACFSDCVDDNEEPFCYDRISHGFEGCPAGKVCCESTLKDCPGTQTTKPVNRDKTCPYECCIDMPDYQYKPCPSGMSCCDNFCKESCKEGPKFEISRQIFFWILLAMLIPIVAFIIFSLKRGDISNIPEY